MMESLEDLHLVDPSDDEDGEVFDSSDGGTNSGSSDSDEDEVTSMECFEGLSVTEGDVSENLKLLGTSLPPDPPLHLLKDLREKYPFAFTDLSERTLAKVLEENPLGFELSDFQVGNHQRKEIMLICYASIAAFH